MLVIKSKSLQTHQLFDHNVINVDVIQLLREPLWEMCTNPTFTHMIDTEGQALVNSDMSITCPYFNIMYGIWNMVLIGESFNTMLFYS